jgi:hypothetical protein
MRVLFLRILAIMNMWKTISILKEYIEMYHKNKPTRPPVAGCTREHFRISHLLMIVLFLLLTVLKVKRLFHGGKRTKQLLAEKIDRGLTPYLGTGFIL